MILNRRRFMVLLAAPLLVGIPVKQISTWKDKSLINSGQGWWGLDELQWCADVIHQKLGDQIIGLSCNHAMRRHLIRLCKYNKSTNSLTYINNDMQLGDVRITIDTKGYDNMVYLHGASGEKYICNLLVPSVQHGPWNPPSNYPAFYTFRGEGAWKQQTHL